MTDTDRGGVAGRVAESRKLAGLTQTQLAMRANVSLSLLRKVEQGSKPASPAFVSTVARALNVGVAELLGQPFVRSTRDEHEMHATIPPLRRELSAYCVQPDEEPQPRPLAVLAADVAEASRLRHAVNLAALGKALPGLLAELRAATWTLAGSEQEHAYWLLAETYYATSQTAYKLGYIDLASLAVDRYEWAAARCGDPLAMLVGDYQRAGEMISAADFSGAAKLLDRSRETIADQVKGADSPTLAMWGNLHLKSGLAAARDGDCATADAHLAEARETAERIGTDRDDYRLCFGPTNVGIWSVGLAVEAQDGTEAVKRAASFTPGASAPRERVGHHWIDLARGYLLHGDHERAVSTLMLAKQTAPQQTRYHPMVHETIRALARARRRSDPVARLAAWAGVRES
ncbi:MAG: helix-turn-helix domain-containing protein [Sciscionella sp.]